MASTEKSTPIHLCVCVHGLWGNPNHLNFLRQTLESQYPDSSGLHILIVKSNAEYNTYDGIEVGGERITNEIEQKIKDLQHEGSQVTKISVVGYSLGGLISRYAIGLLYKNGVFDNIQPVNFTTFATPHLGVRTPKRSYGSSFFNFMGARTLSNSGQQMFTIDNFRASGRPLLSIMADENSIFMKGLRSFKNRSIYANIINDRTVPYYTSGISRVDPFVDLDKVSLQYLQDQDEPVILDQDHPVFLRDTKREKQSTYQRISLWAGRNAMAMPFYALFFLLVPIVIPTFLANSVYQTYKSTKRVKLHESGQAGISPTRYRIPLLEEAQGLQERIYGRLSDVRAEEYLPTPPPERADSDSGSSVPEDEMKALARTESVKESSPFPILALTKAQFRMIDELDRLGFEKFAVHIQRHRHTHAAIVVRIVKDGFAEGKVVVKHWASRFEV